MSAPDRRALIGHLGLPPAFSTAYSGRCATPALAWSAPGFTARATAGIWGMSSTSDSDQRGALTLQNDRGSNREGAVHGSAVVVFSVLVEPTPLPGVGADRRRKRARASLRRYFLEPPSAAMH
jgi:hypothetical protein